MLIPLYFSSREAAAPRTLRSGGRAGEGPISRCICFYVFGIFTAFVRGRQALGGIPFFKRGISRGMQSKACLGIPWGPSYEHICKKFRLNLVIIMVEKRITNYIEWCFRLKKGWIVVDIMTIL